MPRLTMTEKAHGAFQAELLNEKVESLGRAGRALKQALARLEHVQGETREASLDDAAAKAWAFMVQRELCGFASMASLIEDLGIPPEVAVRLGSARTAVE